MILDCHAHVNNYDDESADALPAVFDRLREAMERSAVDAAMILTSYKINPGRPPTSAVVRLTRDLPNLWVVAGVSYLGLDRAYLDELREYLQDGLVRGLKLYPGYEPFYPSDHALHPVYELAEEFRVPVMIHSGDTFSSSGRIKYSHPIHVDDVAVDHRGVDFVICHLGNPWFRDTMEVVYKNENVFTDISGLVLGDFTDRFERWIRRQLQEMLLFGVEPDRVLYGTDWPISSMRTYVRFMEQLRIPEEDRRKISWDNAARLFRVTAPSAA